MRKAGRPVLPENERKISYIRARVAQKERDEIKLLAKTMDLTVSELILLGINCLKNSTIMAKKEQS